MATWTHYTPVGAPNAPGKFDSSAGACVAGQAGMRNQNIYSARLTWGLIAGSPGNSKPLDPTMPRGFVVFAQNTTTVTKTFRFSIPAPPVGGIASFTQSPTAGVVYPLMSLDVSVPAKSMVSRTVFVTSTDPKAQVPVDIQEVTAPKTGSIIPGGLASRVVLNPDISNPEISNPEISNPEISNPEISNTEVYNPEISNPEISNPEISNPEISNPEISNPEISNVVVANPEISNPEISNPEISNPEISNPEISNPEISNPEISNGAITDVTWTIVNTGNTTASFNVNLFLANAAAKLAGPNGTGVQGGIKTQLVVHKAYTTPVAVGCLLKQEPHTVLVANVLYPKFSEPGTSTAFDPANADVTNTTLWLEPGAEGKITLRIVDPNPRDAIKVDPVNDVTPVVTAEPKNTPDIGTPVTPPSTTPPAAIDVNVALGFTLTGQPTNTAVNGVIAPITVHALSGAVAGAGIQVTLAIALNPSGGHLSGTTTVLTDTFGDATFSGLSIEKAGVGYQLSASASASGALPVLSDSFNIGAVAPPPPAGWTAAGSGIVTLLDNGLVGGTPRMTYDNPGVFNGAWTVSNVATAAGPVRLDWEWTGFHSYCAARARIEAFVNHLGAEVVTGPFVDLTDGCVNANNPSSGFTFDGSAVVAVQAGDTYGFRLVGGHFDGGFAMNGTFAVIVNGATSPSPYVVTNASDGGPGSLRAAMLAANAALEPKTITFAIPGAWVHTIAPATPLPVVSASVLIDGLSQPGAASMAPMINVDGRFLRNSDLPGDDQPGTNIGVAPGFEVTGSDVTIRGLGINRFPGPGVFINNGTNNVHVEDSTIGAGPAGVATWPANNVGVWANYSSNHVIARNVISSSEFSGIILAGGSGTSITGNRIGTSVDGLAAMPNLDNGITMYDGTNGTVIDGNVISGNGTFGATNGHGIDVQDSGGPEVTNTVITNNTIGLDINGNLLVRGATNYALGFGPVRRGNAGDGIHLNRASGTIVGGPGAGNVISGNRFSGVLIEGTASGAAPRIIGNVIGTNAAGTAARANGRKGVFALSAAVVGEPGAGHGNVISANLSDGVHTAGGTLIENNLIGTDITGTLALGNGRLDDVGDPNDPGCCHAGVFAARLNNIVRGNVISGNRIAGIRSGDSGPVPWGDVLGVGGNLIEDNKIGTDITGLLPIPNGEGIGLYHDQSGTVVRRNTVAFNTANGVFLVEGTIGATIGGANPADANSIHNNGSNGVAVGYNPAAGDTGNSILSNVIYGNSSLAIDLASNGPTANDATDADAGPNGLMNKPVVASAENAATTSVDFTLDSIAGPFVIQFFRGAVCGNAELLVTSTSVPNGHNVFDLGQLLPVGTFVMATATDAAGNTSELSACAQVVAPPPANPFVVTSTADTLTLGTLRYALTEANLTVAPDTITFAIPGGGAQTITLTGPLPAVTAPVTIDATTQGVWDGRPMVRVDGVATAMRGLELQSPSTIKGLSLTRFIADAAILVMNGAAGSIVERNHIGTDRDGTAGLGNALGVKLNYTNAVVIRENLISGNVLSGVQVTGGNANEIRQNGIGTGLNNTGALPNADNGITLFDGANGTIIDFNVVSGNGAIGGGNGWGIDVQAGLADVVNTVITNNIIGLDAGGNLISRGAASHTFGVVNYGSVDRGNAAGGIRVAGGAGTVIGAVGSGNTISGNTTHGIYLTAAAPGVAPTVRGNRIGTDPGGSARRANGGAGVLVEQANITIGGAAAGEGNVVSGNLKEGIEISADGVAVQGNYIGTDATGMAAIGNGPKLDVPVGGSNRSGIVVNGNANVTIGGPGTARNLISGNRTGVMVFWGNANIEISGNFIGTNKDLSGFLPNSPDGDGEGGIALYGGTNATIAGNNISGNTGYGGGIFTGTGPIGADVENNTIRNNTGPGINVRGGPGGGEPLANMKILGNVIFGNTGIGIDLDGNGATVNDPGDGDTGSNKGQNYPVIAWAQNAATTSVNFTLDSAVGAYTVQFFRGSACGRAEQLITLTNVNNGNTVFDLGQLIPIGTWVMATATDAAGNTSELSTCVQVVLAPPPAVITSASPANGAPGDGFMVLRGTNLPAGLGDSIAVVVTGATTQNGFVFASPTTPTAVYVRLPFGQPLGASTVQIKNLAGTIVSNAFPITITATPGTPVITAVRDGLGNVLAAPVAAGSTIDVSADGIDTTGAVVRFTQGANTWDVGGTAVSNGAIGLALQVTVPAGAAAGPINVSIRQGASAFSAAVVIGIS